MNLTVVQMELVLQLLRDSEHYNSGGRIAGDLVVALESELKQLGALI